MKAGVIEAFGPDVGIQVRDDPRPEPGHGQVLVIGAAHARSKTLRARGKIVIRVKS